MIIALIALVLSLFTPTNSAQPVVIIPAMPSYAPAIGYGCGETLCNCYEHGETIDCDCWVCFEDDAYEEYCDQFTALFNSYSYKVSKNGRSMINGKFVKMGSK